MWGKPPLPPRYHTPLDEPSYIPPSSVAQLGRSVLSAARAIGEALAEQTSEAAGGEANSDHRRPGYLRGRGPLNKPHANAQIIPEGAGVVFFDICGLAWITYQRTTARLLDLGERYNTTPPPSPSPSPLSLSSPAPLSTRLPPSSFCPPALLSFSDDYVAR